MVTRKIGNAEPESWHPASREKLKNYMRIGGGRGWGKINSCGTGRGGMSFLKKRIRKKKNAGITQGGWTGSPDLKGRRFSCHTKVMRPLSPKAVPEG